jgi:glucose-6-phosphate 1-dehydrogenase
VSQALLDSPPDVQPYRVGTWGPSAIQDLIKPRSWRLPFERGWRQRP